MTLTNRTLESFRLRCRSFLLSKFASQIKLIHSVVQIVILGICTTSSILRVLLSGFWVFGCQVPSPKDPFPGSWLSGSHVPWSQIQGPQCKVPVPQDSRVSGSQVPSCRSQSPGFRVSGYQVPGSQVLILCYAVENVNFYAITLQNLLISKVLNILRFSICQM